MSLEVMYLACGIILLSVAVLTLQDRYNPKRLGSASFWAIYGFSFLLGDHLPDFLLGLMVIALAVLAASGHLTPGKYSETTVAEKSYSAKRFQNRLFLPVLLPPVVIISLVTLSDFDALPALGIGALTGWLASLVLTKEKAVTSIHEGRRLIDSIGWAVILSQFLAALGHLFGQAEVGEQIAGVMSLLVNGEHRLVAVISYCLGMVIFTLVMGNAFAAFAVITMGIGIPWLIVGHQGNPAIIGIFGMLSGYCGTLLTPMAANFNIVPAALLELEDKYAVIKAQFIPGILMLIANIFFMYHLAF